MQRDEEAIGRQLVDSNSSLENRKPGASTVAEKGKNPGAYVTRSIDLK